jgi:tRNA U34 2-thiouridine synthase MnmA/TrmU
LPTLEYVKVLAAMSGGVDSAVAAARAVEKTLTDIP